MKCDPRAFGQCPFREFCGSSAGTCDFAEGSDCDKFNQQVLSQPPTYGDRIRSMSDEELGIFLAEWAEKPWAWKKDGEGECLYWLKQPAEV